MIMFKCNTTVPCPPKCLILRSLNQSIKLRKNKLKLSDHCLFLLNYLLHSTISKIYLSTLISITVYVFIQVCLYVCMYTYMYVYSYTQIFYATLKSFLKTNKKIFKVIFFLKSKCSLQNKITFCMLYWGGPGQRGFQKARSYKHIWIYSSYSTRMQKKQSSARKRKRKGDTLTICKCLMSFPERSSD